MPNHQPPKIVSKHNWPAGSAIAGPIEPDAQLGITTHSFAPFQIEPTNSGCTQTGPGEAQEFDGLWRVRSGMLATVCAKGAADRRRRAGSADLPRRRAARSTVCERPS